MDPIIIENCEKCLKPLELCICSLIEPMNTNLEILILQHPQEPDHQLGTAQIAHLALKKSSLKIGLSWPNIKKALGKEALSSEWVVFYLGSGIKESSQTTKPTQHPLKNQGLASSNKKTSESNALGPIHFVNKKGEITSKPKKIKGIVLLDGTWSQAKALWWRNAWLLKLNRAILIPNQPSLYKNLRKEPRKECMSTIETIGEALTTLGEDAKVEKSLKYLFSTLLEKKKKKPLHSQKNNLE